MPKNVVVCCDGTANEFASDATNVLKLYSALVHDEGRQVVSYHPGVGTMEATGALSNVARNLTKLLGLAIGYGLERDILDAYAFLMRHYEAGDHLYLFGFSRGAYTVRAVASLLHMYGLMRSGHEPMIAYVIRMAARRRFEGGNGPSFLDQAERFKATFADRECPPHFVGVWDTVSSVGWIGNPLHFPYTANNPSIRTVRHAVALDERRAFFRTNLWRPDPPPAGDQQTDLRQVWFPGVHCDVGGGYPEAESGLSKFALEWMASEAHAKGLLLNRARLEQLLGRSDASFAPPDPNAPMHESLTWKWWLAEFLPKRRPDGRLRVRSFRRREPPPDALVHEVAWLRSTYVRPPKARAVTTDLINWPAFPD
ncbi:DUF2235 domain-containing protein [Roseomonas sp. GCM10028921]